MPESTLAAFDFASGPGVRNVSDRLPPHYLRDTRTTPQQTAGNNASNAYHNAIGRYFFVKVDANFWAP